MANRHRGEVPLRIGGAHVSLRLTLGGLAELEDAMGAGDLVGLGERLGSGRLRSRDLIAILRIGLKGAGHAMADGEIENLATGQGLAPIITAIAAMFAFTFGEEAAAATLPPPGP